MDTITKGINQTITSSTFKSTSYGYRFRYYIRSTLRQKPGLRRILYIFLLLREKFIYTIPQIFSKRYREVVVGGTIVLKPRNLGLEFEVDSRSDLVLRTIVTGEYEPELTNTLRQLPIPKEGIIINVGANVGFFALFLARIWDKVNVIAVEPNPSAFELLCNNIERNSLTDRVTPVNCCLAETSGSVELATVEGRSEYSSIGAIVHPSLKGRKVERVCVPKLALSSLETGDRRIEVLLVDVEGAEYLVLKGAMEVIRNHRPIVILECYPPLLEKFGHTSAQLFGLLNQEGYELRNASIPEARIKAPFDGEVMALPSEMLPRTRS